MSLTVTGTVVDENGTGLGGLLVEARGDWLLTSEVVDSTTTRNTGDFTLVLAGMLGEPTHPSSCRIRVVDDLGRPISDDKDVPGTDGNQAVGRITVRTADRTGLLVTNGKGEARMVSEGNAMTVLIDGKEAFGSAADDMEAATTSLNMTQLFFTTPDYKLDPADEKPKLVFSFGPPTIVPLDPLPSGQEPTPVPRPKDRRPERLVLDAARRKVAVRILLNEPVASWPEGVFWLLALPAAAAGLGTGAVWLVAVVMGAGVALLPIFIGLAFTFLLLETYFAGKALDSGSDVPELQAYMAKGLADIPQPRGDIIVRGFEQPAPGQRGPAHQDGHRRRAAGHRPRIALLPAVLRRPAAPDRQPASAATRRPTSSTTSASAWSARWSATCTRRSGRTGTRTRRRATRSRRCRPTRSPRRSPAGPTAWSRSRSSAPSAPAGSASSTGPARRASSRATCGPSARRSGSSTWRTSTSPTRSSPTPWPRSSRTSPGWS